MKQSLLLLLFIFFISPLFSQKSAEKIYRQYNDAVVRIYASNNANELPISQGSGVIIKKKRWIITNYHITNGKGVFIFAQHKGKRIKLDSIWAVDVRKDIMILAFSSRDSMAAYNWVPDIKIGNSDKLRVGQKVYAIGSPFGFENTMTDGIISGMRSSSDTGQSFIQISAPISPGSSGGAILNAKGELIAISSMVFQKQEAQNINFAIPVNEVMKTGENHTRDYKINPEKYVNSYYQQGNSEFQFGQYDSAIINYKRALYYSEDSIQSALFLYSIGLVFTKIKDYDSANFYLNRSLKLKKIADTYYAMGEINFVQHKYDAAIQNYKAELVLYADAYNAYIGLVKTYMTKKDYDNAGTYLNKAIKKEPKNPATLYYTGQMALDAKMYDYAIKVYQLVLDLKPDYADAYLAIAQAYLMKGDTDKANEYRQKGYELNNSQSNK